MSVRESDTGFVSVARRSIAPLLLLVLATMLTVWKVRVAIEIGPGWDAYAFLANAADFAGKGFGYVEPHRPPLISLLTSLWFRVAPLSEAAIQWMDGALTLSGVPAFYFLLKKRVNPILAFGGSLAFLGVTPLWEYLGVGYTDTAAISLSAWTLLATIAATERHPGFYLLAGPLFTASVMMRYTALLFVFPLLVWLLLRWRPFLQARYIAAGAFLAISAYVPFGFRYATRFGDALFPFLFAFAISETIAAPSGEAATSAQAPYYIQNLPTLLGPPGVVWLGIGIIAIAIYGLYIAIVEHFSNARPRSATLFVAILAVLLIAITQYNLGLAGRQFAIFLVVWFAWRSLLAPAKEEGPRRAPSSLALDAAMLTWFLVYLDFHGHQTIQVSRYFITMAPGLIYFTLLGWQILISKAHDVLATTTSLNRQVVALISMTLSIPVATVLAAAPLVQTSHTPRDPNPLVAAARDSAYWLKRNDPDIVTQTVYSDLWPLTAWYTGTNARAMPFFEELEAYAHELDKAHADYFVTIRPRRFDPYRDAYVSGPVTVLARTETPPAELPRVAYLGKSWDNYVEQLAGHTFYLDSSAGRYGFEGSSFLDAYDSQTLASFDAVAVAGFRWWDRDEGETALREYVESGGSIVIDASQNLGGLAHSVSDTIMLDTMIRRAQLPADATIDVRPAFAARHPGVGRINASPWIDETGGSWSGAVYEERPGTPPLETLATVGGRPLVQLQRLGKGRVYWIAFNLPWHAFTNENPDEARLVRAIFDDAIAATGKNREATDAASTNGS